jgi:hypothetical protein
MEARMVRAPITAAVVEEIDRLLAMCFAPATISEWMNVSEYLVHVIDGDAIGKGRRPPHDSSNDRSMSHSDAVDAMTIRRIQRMLAVRWLNREQIAQEVGVLANTVSQVAHDRRLFRVPRHREVGDTQAVLREPIRCKSCGASISIAPCHACYTRLVIAIEAWQQTFSRRFPRLTFRVVRLFDLLLKYLKRTQGAKTMQDVTTMLSTEIAAFVGATDKREYLISRAEKLFDEVVEPIDLPGPDKIIDPLLRAAIRPLVGRVYDEMLKKLEAPAHVAA